MDFDQELDTSGLSCPMPIMKTKKTLKKMASGEVLHLIATDPATSDDIPGLVDEMDSSIEATNEDDGKYHFYIKKA